MVADYQESFRRDLQATMLELCRPENANRLRELASDARSNGEGKDVADVMGQAMKGVSVDCEFYSSSSSQASCR